MWRFRATLSELELKQVLVRLLPAQPRLADAQDGLRAELRNQVEEVIKQQPRANQPVIMERLETINNYGPEFVATGQAGFNGYLIFGFPAHKLYVLESTQVNNATYVFADDWEELSKKTKAEILNHDLQEDRIIHRKSWFYRVRTLLGNLE